MDPNESNCTSRRTEVTVLRAGIVMFNFLWLSDVVPLNSTFVPPAAGRPRAALATLRPAWNARAPRRLQ